MYLYYLLSDVNDAVCGKATYSYWLNYVYNYENSKLDLLLL